MFDFFLQDQCLPTAAGALAEQVGSFDLFGLFVCFFSGWFFGWLVGLLVCLLVGCFVGCLVSSVLCLMEQAGFFDLVDMLMLSVICNKNNLKIYDLFIQRFVVEEQNQKVYLEYLIKRSG